MWSPFKRRSRHLVTFDEYYKERLRRKREDPKAYEEDQRRALEWALRMAELRRQDNERRKLGLTGSESVSKTSERTND
jgi:uridine kinase